MEKDLQSITEDVVLVNDSTAHCSTCDTDLALGKSNRWASVKKHTRSSSHNLHIAEKDSDKIGERFTIIDKNYPNTFIRKQNCIVCCFCKSNVSISLVAKNCMNNVSAHVEGNDHKGYATKGASTKRITSFFAPGQKKLKQDGAEQV